MNAWLYAVLSLTVIRMLAVAISLYGKKLGTDTVLFVGWFGPRGIASVLYLLLVANMLGIESYERILSVIVLTVLLSVSLTASGRHPAVSCPNYQVVVAFSRSGQISFHPWI
jgi:NhaP-type Na+/H+ or K+/H+ antiporter